jgi:hypothetical protein
MMQTAEQIGVVLVSAGGGVATYFLTKRSLSGFNLLRSVKLLALCVSAICFFALVSAGPIILAPFTALGIAGPLLLFGRFLTRRGIIQWPSFSRQMPASLNRPLESESRNQQQQSAQWISSARPKTLVERRRKKSKVIPIEIMEEVRKSGMHGNNKK